ncbi:MAG: ROK family protein [Ruminococcaceae bacterium]|nr:ROK family protein [Oscillospiraceae bacterium]
MYNLGIDLGGTGIKTGVVDDNYNIIGRGVADTKMPRPADEIMDDIAAACFDAIKDAGLTMDDIDNIGIGTPGTVNAKTGVLEFAGNLGMHNYPMGEALEKRLGKKVILENDANAAAFGELFGGAAKGAKSAVCVTLGTGVGSGIILDGNIFCGSNFAGGEIGHTVIVVDGLPCNCGRCGCWEKYASATALIAQTKEAMENNPESKMWEIAGGSLDNVNGKTAFDALRADDESGKAVVEKYVKYVACGVINIINTFQPDIVCIGGGISKERDTLLEPMRQIVERERFSKYSVKQTELVAAELGNDAGIIGAAYLFRNGN